MRHLCGRSFSRENEENRWKSKNKKQKGYEYMQIFHDYVHYDSVSFLSSDIVDISPLITFPNFSKEGEFSHRSLL